MLLRLYKSIVSTKYQISGRRHSLWIISISQNYKVNGMPVNSFGFPNFLFNMFFISWLHNMEVMKRISIMKIIRGIIIVLICLQVSLISKRYSRRLSSRVSFTPVASLLPNKIKGQKSKPIKKY